MERGATRAVERQPRAIAALSSELVICTKDRPAELSNCLASLASQTRMPDRVRVVDSSDGEESEAVVGSATVTSLGSRLCYTRSEPGLTRQRNVGVRLAECDVVLFVDDDTVLEPGYVSAVMDCFENDPDLLGVGGVDTNPTRWMTRPAPFLQRVGLLNGSVRGRVLASGRNTPPPLLPTAPMDVEWLWGYAMSYRRSVFETFAFNEDLPGFAAGEDVEFSYRVRQVGRLVVSPGARLAHVHSPANRQSRAQHTRREIISRARRVHRRVGRTRPAFFWWSVACQVLGFAGQAARGRRDALPLLRATLSAIPPAFVELMPGALRDRTAARAILGKGSATYSLARACSNWPVISLVLVGNKLPRVRARMPATLRINTRSGLKLDVPNHYKSRWPVWEVLFDDEYRLGELKGLVNGDAVRALDVGAHLGSFALAVCATFPEATLSCFEPSPTSFDNLRHNVDLNDLGGRVQVRQAAVAAHPGSGQLYEDTPGSWGATILESRAARTASATTCELIDWETACASLEGPTLVKLDVEGAEYDLLLRSPLTGWDDVRYLLLEYHPVPGESWERLCERLCGLGFTMRWHNPIRADQGTAFFTR